MTKFCVQKVENDPNKQDIETGSKVVFSPAKMNVIKDKLPQVY